MKTSDWVATKNKTQEKANLVFRIRMRSQVVMMMK